MFSILSNVIRCTNLFDFNVKKEDNVTINQIKSVLNGYISEISFSPSFFSFGYIYYDDQDISDMIFGLKRALSESKRQSKAKQDEHVQNVESKLKALRTFNKNILLYKDKREACEELLRWRCITKETERIEMIRKFERVNKKVEKLKKGLEIIEEAWREHVEEKK